MRVPWCVSSPHIFRKTWGRRTQWLFVLFITKFPCKMNEWASSFQVGLAMGTPAGKGERRAWKWAFSPLVPCLWVSLCWICSSLVGLLLGVPRKPASSAQLSVLVTIPFPFRPVDGNSSSVLWLLQHPPRCSYTYMFLNSPCKQAFLKSSSSERAFICWCTDWSTNISPQT